MLATLNEVMQYAEEKGIAIGSFNTPGLEALEAVIGAAEELQLPVIIQIAQCHEEWISLSKIGPVMVSAAKEARVPVCVHLDHGETLEYLKQALELRFTAVMYDGSTLPYEENLENTQRAVAMARQYGASVEAELGSMGRRESGAGDRSGAEDETKIYTDPALASAFVKATGGDARAWSFGTTHGIYLTEPRLDFNVVREVRKLTGGISVVMHGGSGVSREDYRKSVEAGVRKINYFTYMDKAGGSAVQEYLNGLKEGEPVFFSSISMAGRKAMKENVKSAMRMFANRDQDM
ncbi:MAG: class II fructose-bisphosphate aldolase [Lachnospiraceae bacterium]|nr:class II fructose-bisphosphate aldolase [Lachnospiraceae bacterium]